MATQITDDKKYLSLFIDRFIPEFFRTQYPDYKLFIQAFFEYLEQKGNIAECIFNYQKFFDIDKINAMKTGTAAEQEIANQLIYQIYEQYVGSKEARYLSTLLDEILFLKNQKQVLQRKGTKYSFLFYFLIMLSGYFQIFNVDSSAKIYNGFWNYDGSINYNALESYFQPYKYLIVSEFYPDQYSKVVNTLNPAGMQPHYVFEMQNTINKKPGDILATILAKPNIYFLLTNTSTGGAAVGIVKVALIDTAVKLSTTATVYDLQMQNGNKYLLYNQSGPDGIWYMTAFNTSVFSSANYFNEVKIISNPTVTGGGAAVDFSYLYADILTLGEVLYTVEMPRLGQVVDNSRVGIMVNFT